MQTIEPEEEDEEEFYTKNSRDIYIPGEYEERDHSGRSNQQIQIYRSNLAFLNRIKPVRLRPKRNMTDEEKKKWLPDSHKFRSAQQNACYVANKQRLAALKMQYTGQAPPTDIRPTEFEKEKLQIFKQFLRNSFTKFWIVKYELLYQNLNS